LNKNRPFEKSGYLKALVVATVIVAVFIALAWHYLPLPNMPGRPGEGERHSVLSEGFEHIYYERGSGPVIALLPSLGRPASDFNELTAALSGAGFRTIAIDLNISRKTPAESNDNLLQLADSVDAVISTLGLHSNERVIVIGHAFGNRLARAFATIHSERVEVVILLAAGGRIPIAEDVRKSLGDCFDSTITNSARLRALRHAFFAKASSIPSYWRVGWDKSLAKIQVHATRSSSYDDWWDAGGVPLLVIQGNEDAIAPAAHSSDLMKAEFGDRVSVSIASSAGHALLPEQPDFIARTIIAFLNEKIARDVPLHSHPNFTYPEKYKRVVLQGELPSDK